MLLAAPQEECVAELERVFNAGKYSYGSRRVAGVEDELPPPIARARTIPKAGTTPTKIFTHEGKADGLKLLACTMAWLDKTFFRVGKIVNK